MDRRKFIKMGGIALPLAGVLPASTALAGKREIKPGPKAGLLAGSSEKADYTIRIDTGLMEVGPQHI